MLLATSASESVNRLIAPRRPQYRNITRRRDEQLSNGFDFAVGAWLCAVASVAAFDRTCEAWSSRCLLVMSIVKFSIMHSGQTIGHFFGQSIRKFFAESRTRYHQFAVAKISSISCRRPNRRYGPLREDFRFQHRPEMVGERALASLRYRRVART